MELNREQIIKAWEDEVEVVKKVEHTRDFLNYVSISLVTNTLALIKELTEENERLQDEANRYKRYYFNHCFDELRANVEADVKADTVREFAERLKAEYQVFDNYDEISIGTLRKDIDKIAKEVMECSLK